MLWRPTRTGCWVSRSAGLAAVGTAVVVFALNGCGAPETPDTPSGPQPPAAGSGNSVITSTTRIASATVLGNDRRPDESCAPEPARLDDGPPDRDVRNATGHGISPPIPESTLVRADPQRIVVLSGDQLDALCALGLQSRIVAAATPDGSEDQPSYLGAVIHDLPRAGSRSDPDLDAVRAAEPDLILGSVAVTPDAHPELAEIAPTVFTGIPGAAWKDTLRAVGAATGRSTTAEDLIAEFDRSADERGATNDATHFQASVVQFTDTTMRVFGVDSFPGSVMADVGVDRPAAQRFTDKPYVEVGITDEDLADGPDFAAAEGDLIYVSFATAQARERAAEVMTGDAWKRLSAVRDSRVYAVNNEVWQTGGNIVAARGMLVDLRFVNAPVN